MRTLWQRLTALIDRDPMLVLAGGGVISLLLYGQVIVRPGNVYMLYEKQLLNGIQVMQNRIENVAVVVGMYLVELLILWAVWRAASQLNGRPAAWALVFGWGLAFGVIFLLMYPYGASDVFDYIVSGRVAGVHGANPYFHTGKEFGDPFAGYAYWSGTPSIYGPIWNSIAAPLARWGGGEFFKSLFLFKGIAGLFLIASAAALSLTLLRRDPQRALPAAALLLWNPMVLYQVWGNGHNDMVMVFFILLAALLLDRRRYTLGLLALVGGALVKFIPLLLLPAAGLIALRELPDWKARLRFVLLLGLASAGLAVLAYGPYWEGWKTLTFFSQQTGLFAYSLPSVIFEALNGPLPLNTASKLVSTAFNLLAVGFALLQGWLAWRDRSRDSFARHAALTLLFYLMICSTRFEPWYSLWPLAVGLLLPWGVLSCMTLSFSLATLMHQYILPWALYLLRPIPPRTYYPTMWVGDMLPAWVTGLWVRIQLQRSAAGRQASDSSSPSQ